jgi:hypothetical protein
MVMTHVIAGRHAEPVADPDEPEVPERASRRTYSAQYKLRILAEYERRDVESYLGVAAPARSGQGHQVPGRVEHQLTHHPRTVLVAPDEPDAKRG